MQNALQMGGSRDFSGWRSMDTAPRDGTIVELKCTYGVAPWYNLFRWSDGRWEQHDDPSMGVSSEDSLHWRPYSGEPSAYADPTGGAQNDAAYWRSAAARAHGLPPDYFEKSAAGTAPTTRPSWWRRLFKRGS